jgi:hypothetical protein
MLFQEKEIEHEEFFITDLKNVESEVTFSVFQALEAYEIYRFKEHRKVFFLL